jgi:hypothetical protein
MESLLETQFQLMEAMKKFLDNFKKDGADRKTPERIPRRLQVLDQYWTDFQQNHERLCEEDVDHPYFSGNQFDITKQFYLTTRQYVSSFMTSEHKPMMTSLSTPSTSKTELSPQSGPRSQVQTRVETPRQELSDTVEHTSIPTGPARGELETAETVSRGSLSKTDEILRKQTSNFRAFVRTVSNISIDHINEKWEFEDALKTLQARWTAIDTLHWEIDSILENRNVTYEMNYNTYEMQYNQIKKEINTKMWSVSHREKSTPKMEIPIFSGSYQHWTSFKDLFTETIHANPSLPNAQKMQFLKSKVKGEAEKLIQHLLISSDNYQTCWDILNHRYNNKKMIFTSHLNILLSLPSSQQHSAASIKKIHDTANECLHAIKNLGVDTTSWDPILVHLLSQKLDAETHNDYVDSLKMPRELPTLNDFLEFLENKFTSLESSRRKSEVSKPHQHYQQPYDSSASNKKFHSYKAFSTNQNMNSKSHSNNSFYTTSKNYNEHYKCPHCKNDHKLFACKPFLGLQPDGKREMIAKYNLCKNCLYDHKGKECHSHKRCRVCNGNHNTLLHDAYGNPIPGTSINKGNAAENKKPNNYNSNHVSQEDLSEILLATALIKVKALDQSQVTLRALIDAGSQTSLVSERAAQILRLPRERCNGVIFGVGAKENNCKGVINITCSALNNQYTFNTDVYVMRNLINNLPNKSFKKPSWDFLENIDLADPEFYISRPVDILLGADIYSNIIQEGIIKHNKKQPLAQQTRIGWILVGNVQPLQCNVVLNNVEDIHKFWSVEDISETSNMSQEELDCLHHYQKTTTRNEEGRYIVCMPLKPDFEEKLGSSKPMAVAQFRQLENKFIRQPHFAEAYKSFMNEYQSLNHMAECTTNETPSCFLPHHGIERESTTSALRVVFNASAKTSTGYTLNDLMSRGPNLQQDLMSLILRWRQYQYVYVADICKMFRQILINTEQQKYQKIVWRASPQEPLREFKLTSISYGTRAAPFLAMMTLKQLAIDEGHKYPTSRATQALQEEFYMDDLVSGSFTLESAKQLQSDLIQLLQSGGFNLRKWSSNKDELLEGVSKAEDIQPEFTFKHKESTTKTLGLKWNPKEDQFTFQMKNDVTAIPIKHTKRSLLSEISKIFDPLGWYTPLTTKFKLLFKQTWLSNIQWDDELPSEIKTEWDKLRTELHYINDFKIPRWYQTGECDNIQLHGFSDSSTKAYACVVYCKVKNKITLVAAKSRLVPETKNLTLPRLELSGGLLLSKLMSKILPTLAGHHIKVFGWTDSTAVLGWLQGDSGRWKPFVANRVKQITEVIPPSNWRYVKSSENPADCASRGITGEQLKQHISWWNGPTFLSSFKEEQYVGQPVHVTDLEVRSMKQSNVTTRHDSDDVIQYILNKFSNMTRAVRVLAWVLRAITRHTEQPAYLTVVELERAKMKLIKYVQECEFKEDLNRLKTNRQLHKNSKILDLNPFLDELGLLRVGGRIKHANISKNKKHPYIIPHRSRLTELIIDHAHHTMMHGGARLTLSETRNNFWIIGGNRAVKKQLRPCVKCRKIKAKRLQQLMGDLPEARINPSRPFLHTGVDFTGFVDIKLNKGRGVKTNKGYIAVFVCMATKAVHFELVSDLSTSAFIAALKRMSSRRGKPSHMYSDNGTNLVGGNNVLQQELAEIQQIFSDDLLTEVNEMSIQWHFNCPAWPHAGGEWESQVKGLKYHLRRVIGEQKLTYEEFYTILTQIEGCMNSRPLCAVSEEPDDLEYLTPSHFLNSGPILTILDTEHDERTRWYRIQKIHQDLWKRWQSEYLSQLSVRSKWKHPQANLKINDIVIIHEPNLPSGKWALGRVTELHPGTDGLVRVVTLKTKSGFMKRPVVKLSLLTTDTSLNSAYNSRTKPDQTGENRKGSKGSLKTTLTSMALSLFLFMVVVSPGHCYYNITKLSKSLYLDRVSSMQVIRDEWRLVVYYDMNPYWDGTETFKKYLQQIDQICAKTESKPLCDIILLQLHHCHSELQYYNSMLLSQRFESHIRERRGLVDGVGYVANSLFGILDQRFADQYAKDITHIKENQKHLALLWKNQTSVAEAEYNLLKRTEASINKQHKVINQHLNSLINATNTINKEVQHAEVMNELALSTIIANNMLVKLKSIQDTLLDTITDIHHGMFNIHLLSPEQLRNELSIISGQLSQDLSLPISNIQIGMAKIYHLLKVKARVTQQYLIFEIKIPLVNRESFDLYKIITIPQQIINKTINVVPVSDHVAINLRKDTYLPMTDKDVQQCLQYEESTRLCHTQKPIFHFKSDESLCIRDQKTNKCQTIISSCRNIWTELNKINTYLYYCCEKCTLRIICDDQVTAAQTERAGVIVLGQSCVIKGEDFTVISHKDQLSEIRSSSDIYTPEISQINHIINITLPLSEINVTDNKFEIDQIKSQIQQMKSETALNDDISYHDVHQYSIIYILLVAAVIATGAMIWRRLRRRCSGSADLRSQLEDQQPSSVVTHAPQIRPRVLDRSSRHELPTELKVLSSIRKTTQNKATSPVLHKTTVINDGD